MTLIIANFGIDWNIYKKMSILKNDHVDIYAVIVFVWSNWRTVFKYTEIYFQTFHFAKNLRLSFLSYKLSVMKSCNNFISSIKKKKKIFSICKCCKICVTMYIYSCIWQTLFGLLKPIAHKVRLVILCNLQYAESLMAPYKKICINSR